MALALPAMVIISALIAACSAPTPTPDTNLADEPNRVLRIAVMSPLSGPGQAVGLGIRNSVDLALRQANDAQRVKGWRLELIPLDSTASADEIEATITRLTSDPSLAAVVLGGDLDLASPVIRGFSAADIVQISVDASADSLTRGPLWATSPQRRFATLFRLSSTDTAQAGYAARRAVALLAPRRAVAVSDGSERGDDQTESITTVLTQLGGSEVANYRVGPSKLAEIAAASKAVQPDVVFFSGASIDAGRLSSQLDQAGVKVPVVSVGGLMDPSYLEQAGAAAEGDLAVSATAPADQLAAARRFVEDYRAAAYRDDPSLYGAQAFDAANIIVAALAATMAGRQGVDQTLRPAIAADVAARRGTGLTGPIGFDQFGDSQQPPVALFEVRNGRFMLTNLDTAPPPAVAAASPGS